MANISLTSYGVCSNIVVPETGQIGLFPIAFGETSWVNSLETFTIQAYPFVGGNKLEDYRELDTSNSWEMTPTIAVGNDYSLAVILDEFAIEQATQPGTKYVQKVVDSSNKITDSNLIGLTISDVKVSREANDNTTAQFFKVTTGVPANATEVQLESVAGELVFFAGEYIGDAMIYQIKRSFSNVKTFYTGDTPASVGSMFFDGVATFSDSSYYIVCPSLKRTGDATLGVGAELNLDVTFKAQLDAGFRKPITFTNVTELVQSGLY